MKIINREISWLHFNSRLLQEASNPDVPLMERVKFLGIYSNNLDEFYRVRVASINRLIKFNKANYPEKVEEASVLRTEILNYIQERQKDFTAIKDKLFKELEVNNLYILNEKTLKNEQQTFVKEYFYENILPGLFTVRLNKKSKLSGLSDGTIYLAVVLSGKEKGKKDYALINIPADKLPRFVVLPDNEKRKCVIRLDDIIRFCMEDIFSVFGYTEYKAYTVKMTKDAEIELYGNVSKSYIDIVADSIKKRKTANPVRFIHDKEMPKDLIEVLIKVFKIKKPEYLVKGERYHNSKDFMNFPNLLGKSKVYKPIKSIAHRDIKKGKLILDSVREKDILLHYPYNSFNYIVNMLREASIDPDVRSIKITLYRLAEDSKIISALINAANNGKSVTAFLELKARFDEKQNIYWSNELEEAGVKIIKTIPGIKVHSKLILIRKKHDGENLYYSNISTGNFNEKTAKLYSDTSLLTANQDICLEVGKVFYLIESAYQNINFDHLIVSPFYTRKRLIKLIENEIESAKEGKEAWIDIKINSVTDTAFINKLMKAVDSGVRVRISARASCSLISPNNKLLTIGIVDKYLEHSRIYMFCNRGENKCYIGSSDLMIRNLDTRIEVLTPIYDEDLQLELKEILDIQFRDNVKARDWSTSERNIIISNGKEKVRTQDVIYKYIKSLNG